MGRRPGKRVQRDVSALQVLKILEDCALAGEPCPSNTDLGALLGYDQSYPSALVGLLEMQGQIAVRRGGRGRVVTILAEGPAQGLSTVNDGRRRLFNRTVDWAVRIREGEEGLSALRRVPVEQLVARDPCTWCGVRGDVGCRHRAPVEPWRL